MVNSQNNLNTKNNYAFIDAQNLHLSIKKLGWTLDYKRFRKYLYDKFDVIKAYIFIGYISSNKMVYDSLERNGFSCVFKPVLEKQEGIIKGNCDTELVLQVMIDIEKYYSAVIVSGDGDFYCLCKHLLLQNKLKAIIAPNRYSYSALYKMNLFKDFVRHLNDHDKKLGYKKRPYKDETL